jgi:hypothetical protein
MIDSKPSHVCSKFHLQSGLAKKELFLLFFPHRPSISQTKPFWLEHRIWTLPAVMERSEEEIVIAIVMGWVNRLNSIVMRSFSLVVFHLSTTSIVVMVSSSRSRNGRRPTDQPGAPGALEIDVIGPTSALTSFLRVSSVVARASIPAINALFGRVGTRHSCTSTSTARNSRGGQARFLGSDAVARSARALE